jgi:serine/threonine protein kinase
MRARQRLLREGTVLRRLTHPNIVRLLDVVEDGDEIVLVMPYLNGGNLAERVAQHGPAPAEEVERLAQRLLGALATAHAAGIIHRDIKPANVLFDDKGEPCLADFGVAHTWDQTSGLTVTGMVVGTPGFMAPEQARDEPLTPASDVFSLGATLLFAATGTGPFGNGDPGLLMVRAADGKVERIPKTVPPRLRRRLAAMLRPRPERRPTAAALLTGDQSALRRPPPRTGITGTGPAMAFVGFAAAVVLVAVGVSARRDDSKDAGAGPDGELPTTQTTGTNEGTPPDGSSTIDPELINEADGVLEPGGLMDSYLLTMGDPRYPECPRQVVITVMAAPEAAVHLLVVQDTFSKDHPTPVIEDSSRDDNEARVIFTPEACGDLDSTYRVEVTSLADVNEAIPYRIIREDS